MTKPEVLGILGLDVGDNWAQGCLLESCKACLGHILASLTHFEVRVGPEARLTVKNFLENPKNFENFGRARSEVVDLV